MRRAPRKETLSAERWRKSIALLQTLIDAAAAKEAAKKISLNPLTRRSEP